LLFKGRQGLVGCVFKSSDSNQACSQYDLAEQVDGLLRQFFLKTNLLFGLAGALKRAVALVNHRPRKKPGYRAPVGMLAIFRRQFLLTIWKPFLSKKDAF